MLHSSMESRKQNTFGNNKINTNTNNHQMININTNPSVTLTETDIRDSSSNGNAKRSQPTISSDPTSIAAYRLPKPYVSNSQRSRLENPVPSMESNSSGGGGTGTTATIGKSGSFRNKERSNVKSFSSSSARESSGNGTALVSANELKSASEVGTNIAGCVVDVKTSAENPINNKSSSLSTSNRVKRQASESVSETGAADRDGSVSNRRRRNVAPITTQPQQGRGRRETSTTPTKHQRHSDNFYSSQSTMHSVGAGKSASRGASSGRHRRKHGNQRRSSLVSSTDGSSSSSSCSGSCSSEDGDSNSTSSGEPNLPYPGFPAIALKYLTQDTRPRNWCLRLITNPWFERISILVIILNCVTLGMYQPCVDDACVTNRCKILQMFDDIIFAFFALEMSIKMVAMGMYGKNTYLADSWNRLDFFIVLAGLLEYVMHVENLNLTAIRTIRVLRPLRAINRIPSMRILVMLLLDTLPMLGNVLLLCFFVFFIFGIIGVQMWEGILRQRCVKLIPDNVIWPNISFYYEFSKEQDYICSIPEDSGMHLCADFPAYRIGALLCNATALPYSYNHPTNVSCVNWNQYYTNCSAVGPNPFQGTISFDNIGMAWVAIFLVISLEGWTDIMYYVQDAHSFWDWIYFVLLIVIGSFFMINLCLVVIATQFAETKKREMERMRQERARYTSTSTLASSTNNSEPATCYAEIVKYIAHLWRRSKRRLLKKYRLYKHQRQQKKEGLLPNADNLTFSPSRIKCHHPKCPKYINRKPSNIQDQMITVMVPLNSNNNVNTTIVAAATAAATSTAATTNSGNGGNTMSTAPQTHTNILPMHSTTANVSSSGGGGGGVIASSGSGIITTGMGPITLNQNLSYSSINSILHHHHAISIGNVANNNSAAGTAINNSLMQNALNHNHHQQNNPVMLAHNGTHNSSSENSELSAEVSTYGQRASNLKKTKPNHLKDDNTSCSSGQKTILLKIPTGLDSEQLINHPCTSGFLSPPSSARRRSSVMFNEFVILHTPPSIPEPTQDKNVCSSEKMTQTGDGTIWQVNLPQTIASHALANPYSDCSELGLHDAMTCQELLAFSVAFSAALPTGHSTLESFYTSLARFDPQTAEALKNHQNLENSNTNNILRGTNANAGNASGGSGGNGNGGGGNYIEDYSCCYDLYQNALSPLEEKNQHRSKLISGIITVYHFITRILHFARRHIKRLVEHKYFQQSILLAILINTLSMGIEYHKQPEELTAIVETSNVVFSAIFAVEMLLKVVAEGPFRYIANGFNVFDGIIVILSAIEICQTFSGNGGGGGSGLSVLRTFRLLRILKLVRFMPNLRRQLFVMLRTMDNVAVFFSLLVLFIFIFSILGMYLFGGKFCKFMDESGQERECTCPEIINKHPLCECDRKHFNNILWATVTVFQILTQEDWNVVLFNGMEKTSHWAALYFVALMTFGNYVLFNLLVAILVEGFSSERNERREREQRELVKKLREETLAENYSDIMYDESRSTSDSSSTNESYYEIRNKWHSAEDVRKLNDATEITIDPKCNIQKQRLLQPCLDYQVNESNSAVKKSSEKDISRLMEDDRKILKKTYSIKERRSESAKLTKLRPVRDPPIIMTTAATPQDSPNTTLESGSTFKNWNQQEFEAATARLESVLKQSHSSPSLLKPPTLLNAQCSLDEGIPSIEFIPPSPVKPHKTPINILSVSNLGSNTSINQFGSNRNLTDDITKNSTTPSTIGDDGQLQIKSTQNSTSSGNTFNTQNQKTPGLNRFRRSSSKKKKNPTDGSPEIDEENIILNNGRDSSQLLSKSNQRIDPFLRSANRIQNNTKDTNNKNSPQNSMRRLSVASSTGGIESGSGGGRRASCVYNNSQFYQNINRHNSMKNYSGRRMSSIEIAFGKASNLNLYNLEANRKSMSYTNSKIDLDKWQKSLSNLNEPEMLQQAKDEKAAKKKEAYLQNQQQSHSILTNSERVSKIKILIERLKPTNFTEERDSYSMYIFPEDNRFRQICSWFVNQKWFDNVVLLFIALNCITLAMERPNIPPNSPERLFLGTANYVFTVVFTVEMFVKVVATGMFYGPDAYFTSGWNIMDGSLVTISIIDLLMSLISESSPRIFGILRVFRLLRSLRPLRVINRAPGLKLVVQTLLSSLRPIGNIVLICCTFFIIFGILGVQLFKGTFYYCEGENIKNVRNMTDCLKIEGNAWINRKYNFDDLGKALMSLFVLSSRDGWVNIMYTGLDAVGVDQQPIVNYNEWRLLYFIAFILLVGFFVLNMFVGVVVENFHRCREEQEKEEKIRRAAKRALQMEKKRRRMHEPPYYSKYSPTRLFVHNVVTSKYFDLAIAAVIGLNVVTMAMEYYKMPEFLGYVLKIFNYFFTAVFILEAVMKVVALGVRLYMKDKWNQLDVGIVILSIVGIVLEELETKIIPINPTIIRVMRVLRIARVLKLLKMAKGIRALLDTVMQALPQVGNLGLLFFLLFFIFAALGVELFGRLECSDEIPCQGLGEHAHFANFGMAFLTLFRVATGDNWNGIMKDTLRDNCDDAADCVRNCCVSSVIAPIFFVIFVLMAQFVLVNVVVAVLMKHLEESHKQMEDEMDMDVELERELVREQEFEEEQALCLQLQSQKEAAAAKKPLEKVSSLPSNFTYSTPSLEKKYTNTGRRQTVQYFNQSDMGLLDLGNSTVQSLAMLGEKNSISEEVADGNDFNESEEARKAVAVSLQVPLGRRAGRRSSIAFQRKRGVLTKERSLDEQAIRRRNFESKQMSCDSLPWGGVASDSRTIFESLESDTSPPPTIQQSYDKRSVQSEDCTAKLLDISPSTRTTISSDKCSPSSIPPQLITKDILPVPKNERRAPSTFGRSVSSDQGCLGRGNGSGIGGAGALLSVPRSMPPRSRSGSTKQLFKQQALDEDPDIDESSLLLPATNRTLHERSATIDIAEGLSKSDSAEILRIISERRRMDKNDNSGNEDSDYNELLLVKTPMSSVDA
ncbi:uncharacterized protein LOC129947020 isoform X4 [Eupeodes corollae]|uniref:uncharacterized protein LOC129947020 isoform X4 n=2 Tax=Eupeodes corollae TaxID=290404 RepID=UPI002490AFD8|nr:uncharacterized protein LOC129947020 isoform X4 [Eupeodes corollae]